MTQKVFELCGTPRLGRSGIHSRPRMARAAPPDDDNDLDNDVSIDSMNEEIELEGLRTRRDAQTSQFVFEKRLEKIHRTPNRPTKSEFEVMLLDLKRSLKEVNMYIIH